jgi:hypothetical protein
VIQTFEILCEIDSIISDYFLGIFNLLLIKKTNQKILELEKLNVYHHLNWGELEPSPFPSIKEEFLKQTSGVLGN